MLIRAFGIPTLGLADMSRMLQDMHITYGVYTRKGLIKREDPRSPLKGQPVVPFVFDSSSTFLRFLGRYAESKLKIVAFIIGDPWTLNKKLGLTCIGVTVKADLTLEHTKVTLGILREVLRQSSMLPEDDVQIVEPNKWDPHSFLLRRYEGSQLSTLQTLLYKIKDVEVRNKVGKAFKDWMVTNLTRHQLDKSLHGLGAPHSVIKSLLDLSEKKGISDLKAATSRIYSIRDKSLSTGLGDRAENKIVSTAKKFKVSPFDIRYLISNVTQSKGPKK